MKKRLPIIIIAVLVVVFAGLGFYSHQKSKIKYNTSYVNGNTAGNLYNAGLFCEKNGTVYFANPDDDYRLYSMDTNGNHLKKLSYDRVMYINADDHYVYYVRNNENNGTGFDFFSYARNSLCRIDQNGENTKILDKDPCLYASLVGNYIYYLHYDDKDATTLYKIGMDSCSGETGIEPPGSDEIIDPPSGVFLAGFKAVGPPGINALGIRIKITEGIRKTGA